MFLMLIRQLLVDWVGKTVKFGMILTHFTVYYPTSIITNDPDCTQAFFPTRLTLLPSGMLSDTNSGRRYRNNILFRIEWEKRRCKLYVATIDNFLDMILQI